MKFLIPYVVFALNLALFMGCSDDIIKPPPPDPCAGKTPVTARFSTYEIVYSRSEEEKTITRTDTFSYLERVLFAADERYDSYEWHIGYDDRVRKDSAFFMSFSRNQAPPRVPLEVVFIGRRKPHTDCFPNDDGIDTARRNIVFLLQPEVQILGSYLGSHTDENPLDTFRVEIFYRTEDFLAVTNINRGFMDNCTKYTSPVTRDIGNASIRFFNMGSSKICNLHDLDGWAQLTPNRDSIIIDYVQTDYTGDRIPHHKVFKGRRIQ